MSKNMQTRGRALQVVVCAMLCWCVGPRAAMGAPQCGSEGQAAAGAEFLGATPKPVMVPGLRGLSVDDARRTLESAGLILGRVQTDGGQGVVVKQSIEKRAVPVCTRIDIWTESRQEFGDAEKTVPDLRGQTPVSAIILLALQQLTYGESSKEPTGEVPPGRIFRQDPPAGTLAPKGTPVRVTLGEAIPSEKQRPKSPGEPQQPKSPGEPQQREKDPGIAGQPETPPTPGPVETVSLTASVTGTVVPREVVIFTASLQHPASEVEYTFDFGDGHTSAPSGEAQARHAYAEDGNYTVRVTASVGRGDPNVSATTDVSVHETSYVVTLEVNPKPVRAKQPVTFTAHVSPAEPAPIEYVFEFGDKKKAIPSRMASITHTYEQANVYYPLVTIILRDKHKAKSVPFRLPVGSFPPVWMIVLLRAGAVVAVVIVGAGGYQWMRRSATRGISVRVSPGMGIAGLRVETAGGGLENGEIQFHGVYSSGVQRVDVRGTLVAKVEVQG